MVEIDFYKINNYISEITRCQWTLINENNYEKFKICTWQHILQALYSVIWSIERTDEIAKWIKTLGDDAKEAILKKLLVLSRFGTQLGRTYVDSISDSRHKNMKELIVQKKKFVEFFLPLIMKEMHCFWLKETREEKFFYKEIIPKADKLFYKYFKNVERKWIRKR